MNLNPLGFGFWASWECAVGIGQEKVHALHCSPLQEWATPAKLDPVVQGQALYSKTKPWIFLTLPVKRFPSQPLSPSFPSMCCSAAFLWQIPFRRRSLTLCPIHCYGRLLQKFFPAPHLPCAATWAVQLLLCPSRLLVSQCQLPRAILLSAQFGAACRHSVKLVPAREKTGFCTWLFALLGWAVLWVKLSWLIDFLLFRQFNISIKEGWQCCWLVSNP